MYDMTCNNDWHVRGEHKTETRDERMQPKNGGTRNGQHLMNNIVDCIQDLADQ